MNIFKMSEYYVALFYYYRGSSHALHTLNSYSTWGTLSRKVENKESKSGFKPIGPQHWSIIYFLQCKATGNIAAPSEKDANPFQIKPELRETLQGFSILPTM